MSSANKRRRALDSDGTDESMSPGRRGRPWNVSCCFDEGAMSCTQLLFSVVFSVLLAYLCVDLLTARYSVKVLELLLNWMEGLHVVLLTISVTLLMAFWTVLLLPMTFVCVAVGFVFDNKFSSSSLAFCLALVTCFGGFCLGASLCFYMGRTILRGWAKKMISHYKVLTALDHTFHDRGRKVNLILRVNPVIPYNVMNYAMGLSESTYKDYCWGLLGALPYTIVSVYVGQLVSSISDLDVYGRTGPWWIALYVLLCLFFVASSWYMYTWTKQEMESVIASSGHFRSVSFADTIGGSTAFGTFGGDEQGPPPGASASSALI